MEELRNSARERLEKGELSLGLGLRHMRAVEIAKAAKTAGFDWLFIDLEHNSMSVETAQQIAVTALDVGIAPLVRVPAGEHALALRLLTGGALGTVMPHVETAEEARAIVAEQKYAPLGHRGSSGVMPHFNFQRVNSEQATRMLNEKSLVVVMLESPEAIARADEIAAVEGVDVLMIGTGDLTTTLGIHGQADHPDIVAAYEQVTGACAKHGKWAGTGGIGSGDIVARYVDMGVQFILAGSDLNFMIQAASTRTAYFRDLKVGTAG